MIQILLGEILPTLYFAVIVEFYDHNECNQYKSFIDLGGSVLAVEYRSFGQNVCDAHEI
jgi:hypothetical protein